MTEIKMGTICDWHSPSPRLAIFDLLPDRGDRFPEYQAGQYIALSRDNCKLTRKIGIAPNGRPLYGPDLDEKGNRKIGTVTHHYSIASAPCETQQHGWLKFYVILEPTELPEGGRLTSSLFHEHGPGDSIVSYQNEINGEFTLKNRTTGFKNVVFVGTGTGVSPFAAMIKQLHHDGAPAGVRYTLLHVNHYFAELAFHNAFMKIERAQKIDFLYVPAVSRPSAHDMIDAKLGMGRANNLLRYVFQMPMFEEENVEKAKTDGGVVDVAEAELARSVRPVLPHDVSLSELRSRFEPADQTVLLCCGNPASMADIRYTCVINHIRFEKEDW